MDKIGSFFKPIFAKLQAKLDLPNKHEFERDFYQIMLGFYACGLTHKIPNFKFFIYVFSALSFLLGMFKDSISAAMKGDLNFTLLFAAIFSLLMANTVQCYILFKKNSRIVDMMKTMQALHEREDDNEVEAYRNLGITLINLYKIFFGFAFFFLTTMRLFGISACQFILPVIYDVFADDFGILLSIHIPHVAYAMVLFITIEMVHVICMIRVEANLKILGEKLKHCADADDLEANEQNLIACIKYHRAILE